MAKNFGTSVTPDNREFIAYGETNKGSELIERAISKTVNREIRLTGATPVTSSGAYTMALYMDNTIVGAAIPIVFTESGTAVTGVNARREFLNRKMRELAALTLIT